MTNKKVIIDGSIVLAELYDVALTDEDVMSLCANKAISVAPVEQYLDLNQSQ